MSVLNKFEKGAQKGSVAVDVVDRATVSSAISLKRIADSLERIEDLIASSVKAPIVMDRQEPYQYPRHDTISEMDDEIPF